MGIHTIPVPQGMSVEDAWNEIAVFEQLVGHRPLGGWANIDCTDGWSFPCPWCVK